MVVNKLFLKPKDQLMKVNSTEMTFFLYQWAQIEKLSLLANQGKLHQYTYGQLKIKSKFVPSL